MQGKRTNHNVLGFCTFLKGKKESGWSRLIKRGINVYKAEKLKLALPLFYLNTHKNFWS